MISANLSAIFYLISGVLFILAAINIFGGFLVTQRMLQMYKKKKDKKKWYLQIYQQFFI